MSTSKSKPEWVEKKLKPAVKKNPEREEQFLTTSGIEIDDVYTPDDRQGFDYNEALGYPGEFPFTRGVQPTMYRGRIRFTTPMLWTLGFIPSFAIGGGRRRDYVAS